MWSPRAEIDLFQIMEFYKMRNGNSNYSARIYSRIKRALIILKQFPGIGANTDILNVKNLILGEFCLFYKIENNSIEILSVWDSKQNPENLNL